MIARGRPRKWSPRDRDLAPYEWAHIDECLREPMRPSGDVLLPNGISPRLRLEIRGLINIARRSIEAHRKNDHGESLIRFCTATEKQFEKFARSLDRARECVPDDPEGGNFRQIVLRELWRQSREAHRKASEWRADHMRNPRQWLYREMAVLWVALGGNPGRGYDSDTGVEGGPFIRFLQTVGEAAFGKDAWKTSSFKNSVIKWAKSRAKSHPHYSRFAKHSRRRGRRRRPRP